MVLILFFLGAQLYFAIFPSSGEPSAENFFATYITLPLFLADYVGFKVCFLPPFLLHVGDRDMR
jgi:amino acid transporter